MSKIDSCITDEKARAKAKEQFEAAKALIKLGPVVFGESHTSPVARAIIWDLIDANLVKRLFTEQTNSEVVGGRSLEQTLQASAQAVPDANASSNQGRRALTKSVEDIYDRRELLNKHEKRPTPAITYAQLRNYLKTAL